MILLGASMIVAALCGFLATHAAITLCLMLVSTASWPFASAVTWRRAASKMQTQQHHYVRAGHPAAGEA
jgi:hypothetical protein